MSEQEMIRRIIALADPSGASEQVIASASSLADRYGAELLVLRVLAPENVVGDAAATPPQAELEERVRGIAGPRAIARVLVDADPAAAILRVADVEGVDVIVVPSAGMSARTEFVLGNVPNRIAHNARCTVVIVNTAEAGAPRAEAEPEEEARPGALLGRAAHIGRVIAELGAHQLIRGGGLSAARRFRGALEELGPTFAKLGQILSTRPDLLPASVIEELAKLQDRVAPLSEREVVAAMERELKVPWEDVFSRIEPEPMAAGTIAQVHRAVLRSGERVVVKVQRPNAPALILRDLDLLDIFAEKASRREELRRVVDIPALLRELSDSLRRELDFRNEAANVERMREILAPYPRLAVPRVYTEISTSRLLVMEEVQGVPVRQAPPGEERREAARQLLESFYQQVLSDGFFHADPHPGNLLWADGKIWFLDLGMAGQLGPQMREMVLLVVLAFWQRDADFLADMLLAMAEERAPDLDLAGLREDVRGLIDRFRELSLKELRLGPLLQQVMQLSVRRGLRLPASLAMAGKAFGQMQLATAQLDPELDPFSVAGTFMLKRLMGSARGAENAGALMYQLEKARARATRLIEAIEGLAGARPGHKLQVDLGGTAPLEAALRGLGRRVTLAILVAGLMIAAGLALAPAIAQAVR